MSTELMIKQFDGQNIFFMEDGWINATIACQRFGKRAQHWLENEQTKELILEISKTTGIPAFEQNQLVKVRRGSPENGGGTWIHPELAVHLAYWLNTRFAVWMGKQIKQIIEDGKPSQSYTRPFFPTWWNNDLGFEQVNQSEDTYCKSNRVSFDQTIKIRCGLTNPTYIRTLTNLVFRVLTGFEVKDFRRGWGIPKGSRVRTRLFVDSNLRRAIDIVELQAMRIIQENSIVDFADIFDLVGDLANAQMLNCRANRIQLFRSVPMNLRLVVNH